MISRVAENIFWLQRYVVRASSLSRLLLTATASALDAESTNGSSWAPVLITCGELPRFVERFGQGAERDTARVLEYLTWDLDCPASIRASLGYARENARRIREAISREVWEAINREWLWIESSEARAVYDDDPTGFYRRVRDAGHLFRGAVAGTMPHTLPLNFMTLGLYVERVDQTARILDVTHHSVPKGTGQGDSVEETVAWIQALQACGGYEAFVKSGRPMDARNVAGFMLLDPTFPRSVRHCLDGADRELRAVCEPGVGRLSDRVLQRMRAHASGRSIDQLFSFGIHRELTRFVDGIAEFGNALYSDFFAPDHSAPGPSSEPQ